MSVPMAIAVFFLIWWVILFAVLPWGVQRQDDAGDVVPGTDPGAPAIPRLGRKLLWTTLLAAVIFAGFYVAYTNHLIPLETLVRPLGLQ